MRLHRLYEADEDSKQQNSGNADNGSAADLYDKLADTKSYEQFVELLDSSDYKTTGFLNYLKQHYKSADDTTLGTIKAAKPAEKVLSCKELIPTQSEISLEKSLGVPADWAVKIINTPEKSMNTPILTYAGKYIIDGHHRWSKIYALNGPEAMAACLDFPAISGMNPVDVLKAVQLAIVAVRPDTKDLKSPVKGANMLVCSDQDVEKCINATILTYPEVVTTLAKKHNINFDEKDVLAENTVKACAEVILGNVHSMQKSNKPIPGAPSRTVMPQADKDGAAGTKVQSKLAQIGMIDLDEAVDYADSLNNRQFLEMVNMYRRYRLTESVNRGRRYLKDRY